MPHLAERFVAMANEAEDLKGAMGPDLYREFQNIGEATVGRSIREYDKAVMVMHEMIDILPKDSDIWPKVHEEFKKLKSDFLDSCVRDFRVRAAGLFKGREELLEKAVDFTFNGFQQLIGEIENRST